MRAGLRCPALLVLLLAPLAVAADHGWSSDGGDVATQDPDVVDMQSVLSALGLLSGAFLVVLLGLRVYLHCMRRRPQRQERRKKMTLADIESKFPVTKYEGGETEETCVVCLCNIEAGEDIRVTQCGHTFHADCLQQWWLHKPRRVLRCPICRRRQRTKDGRKRSKELEVPDIDAEGANSEAVAGDGVATAGEHQDDGARIGELSLSPSASPSTAAPSPGNEVDHSSSGGDEDAEENTDKSGEAYPGPDALGIIVAPSPKSPKVVALDGPHVDSVLAVSVSAAEEGMTVMV